MKSSSRRRVIIDTDAKNEADDQFAIVHALNFQGQFANNSTGLAAGILIAVVPILIAYIFLQRWIVGGLTAGATKG